MDVDLDYRYLWDCEYNPENRLCDAIRSQLMQLVAQRNSIPLAAFLERQRDLLQKYSIEIDKRCGPNTFISSVVEIISKENSERECSAEKWRSTMKKKFEGLSTSELFENSHLKNMVGLSSKFHEYNKNRIILLQESTSESSTSKIAELLQKHLKTNNLSPTRKSKPISRSSPTRVPGLFKKKCQNDFSLFPSSLPSSQSSLDNENNQNDCLFSQFHVLNENEKIEKKEESKEIRKKSFITGLEKHLVDQVINNGLNKEEARKIIIDVRKENNLQLFKDPMMKIKSNNNNNDNSNNQQWGDLIKDEKFKGIEPAMIELIQNTIVHNLGNIDWSNIVGLEYAKQKIHQAIILPLKRPDLLTGLRSPPKGVLLFGPPGTGKTMIGKCIASKSNATFFSITSSILTSKWIGDGEKAMKTMFAVARHLKPSVIFIDEIDSLLKSRSDTEHESCRRMKTEFLAQFDGLSNQDNDGVLVIGTTNRPQELDEAVRRRFAAKLYIPLPKKCARKQIIQDNLKDEKHSLTEEQIINIAEKTEGYSGSDMKNLCSEAAMYSIQEIDHSRLDNIEKNEIRDINFEDFQQALNIIKPSFSNEDLKQYELWNKKYGSDSH